MEFKNYLNQTAGEIDLEIKKFFQKWDLEIKQLSPKLSPLIKVLAEGCQGGKKLRGTLVKLGFEIAQNSYNPEILKASAGYEIFNTSIFAHDDIIDKGELRRGKPSIPSQLGNNHYGISQAIVLGDIGFFIAVKLIANSNFTDHIKNIAIVTFSNTVINTGLGQALDIELPLAKEKVESDVTTIQKLKTAHYTIIDPLTLGIIFGGGEKNKKVLKAIEEFGEALGIAFQIQDDILGVFGDEKTLGKSVTSDIEEGKNTLLITQAQKRANSGQRAVLDSYYGKGKIGESELEAIRKVFKDTGSLDYSRQVALKYVVAAKKVIPKITKEPKYSQLLSQMADFLVEREK